jgi:hypothetical protein
LRVSATGQLMTAGSCLLSEKPGQAAGLIGGHLRIPVRPEHTVHFDLTTPPVTMTGRRHPIPAPLEDKDRQRIQAGRCSRPDLRKVFIQHAPAERLVLAGAADGDRPIAEIQA